MINLLVLLLTPLAAQDAPGSKDHPLIQRYEGSRLSRYSFREFDEFTLPLGRATRDSYSSLKRLEGKVTNIEYMSPLNRSVLEVTRNYEAALSKGGFEILFRCKGDDCGPGSGERMRISARLARPQGDVYATLYFLYAGKSVHIVQHVVEIKPMQSGMVKVDAGALAGDISRTGHSAVYGIYFDTARWDVKPESAEALREIAKLLAQDTQLRLHVVGHTDSAGTLDSNRQLSRRRAESVVRELTTSHGVAASRLQPDGVGPLCPVASNRTEEGRARNRRVELVEQ